MQSRLCHGHRKVHCKQKPAAHKWYRRLSQGIPHTIIYSAQKRINNKIPTDSMAFFIHTITTIIKKAQSNRSVLLRLSFSDMSAGNVYILEYHRPIRYFIVQTLTTVLATVILVTSYPDIRHGTLFIGKYFPGSGNYFEWNPDILGKYFMMLCVMYMISSEARKIDI